MKSDTVAIHALFRWKGLRTAALFQKLSVRGGMSEKSISESGRPASAVSFRLRAGVSAHSASVCS
jgi:hypothetical protein